ncbi:hypothetical protein EDWATA_01032 [Edwardsiella tarda ATCC 23685]|uniref:Uncharacterized protein n=1 Tax=Edwardsiella tarda ATCC 23685 TaxID=500638 RepID=D4F2T1_EDWTA|nr:hypothetical protein EDWATA_01032 [Edwardsiella tarda ATCC 23685]
MRWERPSTTVPRLFTRHPPRSPLPQHHRLPRPVTVYFSCRGRRTRRSYRLVLSVCKWGAYGAKRSMTITLPWFSRCRTIVIYLHI